MGEGGCSREQAMPVSFLAQRRMHCKFIRTNDCSMNSVKFKIRGQKDFPQVPDDSG